MWLMKHVFFFWAINQIGVVLHSLNSQWWTERKGLSDFNLRHDEKKGFAVQIMRVTHILSRLSRALRTCFSVSASSFWFAIQMHWCLCTTRWSLQSSLFPSVFSPFPSPLESEGLGWWVFGTGNRVCRPGGELGHCSHCYTESPSVIGSIVINLVWVFPWRHTRHA